MTTKAFCIRDPKNQWQESAILVTNLTRIPFLKGRDPTIKQSHVAVTVMEVREQCDSISGNGIYFPL